MKKYNGNNSIELLAPAGSYAGFLGVLNAGADAIYAGGKSFGARAYANNFTTEEMVQAIRLAHLYGRRFYLTLNTILKNEEMRNELYDYFLPFYEAGVDGVIVQDFGVAAFLREFFPDVELHASTQMTVCGEYGANFLKEKGFCQVVLPRELSIDEISEIHKKTDVKLEVFTHGALCYCYSGQCLMSSVLGGRSGNRGRCAQPCRLSYDSLDANGNTMQKSSFLLSLKDAASLELLPGLIRAGVSSLKIEGRMKTPEYATGVTALYRKYLDLALRLEAQNQSEKYAVTEADAKALLALGNRSGFTDGYLNGKGRMHSNMISPDSPSHEKMSDHPVLQKIFENNLGEPPKLSATVDAYFYEGSAAVMNFTVGETTVTVTGDEVQTANNRPMSEQDIADKLLKFGGTPYEVNNCTISCSEHVFLPVKSINELRRKAVEEYEKTVLCSRVARPLSITTVKPIVKENPIPLYVSCKSRKQYDYVCNVKEVERIYLDIHGDLAQEWIKNKTFEHPDGKEIYLALPLIFRQNQVDFCSLNNDFLEKFDGFLIRNIDEIPFVTKRFPNIPYVTDANIYTANDFAAKEVMDNGALAVTVPYELNAGEIRYRNNRHSELVIYGRYPLMISAQCVYRNSRNCCAKKQEDHLIFLKDRYRKDFPVELLCDICTNRVLNSLPTSLLGEIETLKKQNFAAFRIDLTLESRAEAEEIMASYLSGGKQSLSFETTRGHYKRGVE